MWCLARPGRILAPHFEGGIVVKIDESLAKGLRRQFWAYLADENKKHLARLQTAAFPPAGDLLNKKIQARFFKNLDAAATSPVALHREVTGKRAGAHWWAIYLDSDPEHAFDSWQEPALRVNVDRVWAQNQLWNPTWLTALVGEHCIARMFQRLPWTEMPTQQSLFPELRELARVLPWYIQAYDHIYRKFEGKRLSVFIPTTNGVFMGVANPQDGELIELRTFVGKHQLRPDQLQLWQCLHALSSYPHISEYLGALLDPTRMEYKRTVNIWHETMIAFIYFLVNHAHLLQDELEALHPSLIRKVFAEAEAE